MQQRIILIGQAPGPNTDPQLPLFPVPSTSAGGRLCELMGVTRGEYMLRTERVNLLSYYPGKWANGDRFPITEARIAAEAMAPFLAGRRVVLIGRNVANAFDVKGDFHVWLTQQVRRRCPVTRCPGLAELAIAPHTSGRNHWYNTEENRLEARRFWLDALGLQARLRAVA